MILKILIYSSLFIFYLKAGVDFTAIIPTEAALDDLVQIQQYIIQNLPKNIKFNPAPRKNLHITLKEISNLSNIERNRVKKTLTKIAKKFSSINLKKTLKNSKLNLSGNIIRLKLPINAKLTKLAKTTESALKKLKQIGKIKKLTNRMDFPNKGHITLGHITNYSNLKSKNLKRLKNILKQFVNKYNAPFIANSFWLLKSNRPKKSRKYFRMAKFMLKNKLNKRDLILYKDINSQTSQLYQLSSSLSALENRANQLK